MSAIAVLPVAQSVSSGDLGYPLFGSQLADGIVNLLSLSFKSPDRHLRKGSVHEF